MKSFSRSHLHAMCIVLVLLLGATGVWLMSHSPNNDASITSELSRVSSPGSEVRGKVASNPDLIPAEIPDITVSGDSDTGLAANEKGEKVSTEIDNIFPPHLSQKVIEEEFRGIIESHAGNMESELEYRLCILEINNACHKFEEEILAHYGDQKSDLIEGNGTISQKFEKTDEAAGAAVMARNLTLLLAEKYKKQAELENLKAKSKPVE